ncbi:MAG: ABC transporter permease [Tepidanaerobacteraceae bacterium]|nr:ABC transporter permease [Tepidanaerobacteraceae bacterium]
MHSIRRLIKKKFKINYIFRQWEWILIILIIIVNAINAQISPYYLNAEGLLDATMVFLDKGFAVLAMAFVIILGDIDISVASIMALSSVVMAVAYSAGVSMVASILAGLLTGTLCGFFNGILISRFKELSSIIVTLSTMSIYRGIAYVILGDKSVGNFPSWFSYFAWGYIGKTHIPFILVVFIFCAIAFGILLHRTTFGRKVYATGNNFEASLYSGVPVEKIKMIVFTLMGLMSAVSAIFLTSRLGSSRPNIALGYELEIIAIVVLGGVSTRGGVWQNSWGKPFAFPDGFYKIWNGIKKYSRSSYDDYYWFAFDYSFNYPQHIEQNDKKEKRDK